MAMLLAVDGKPCFTPTRRSLLTYHMSQTAVMPPPTKVTCSVLIRSQVGHWRYVVRVTVEVELTQKRSGAAPAGAESRTRLPTGGAAMQRVVRARHGNGDLAEVPFERSFELGTLWKIAQ